MTQIQTENDVRSTLKIKEQQINMTIFGIWENPTVSAMGFAKPKNIMEDHSQLPHKISCPVTLFPFFKTSGNSLIKNIYLMRVGGENFPNPSVERMTRSYYRSYRHHSLHKTKHLPVSGLQISQVPIREKLLTESDENTEKASNTSINNSPMAIKRFPSASRDSSPSPAKSLSPVRIKSVLLSSPSPKKARLSIQPSFHHPTSLLKLSQMFSTATTFQNPKLPSISAHAYCVMTSSNRKVVLGSSVDSKRQVASLTKLMTALTVFNICKRYGVDMGSTMVQMDQQAAGMEGTTAGLRYGDELTVTDLMHGMLLPSGNDAASALASYFGKFLSCMYNGEESHPLASKFELLKEYYDVNYKDNSIKLFMFEMNRIAGEIGLKDTYFQNPTGLQHQNSYSTAYDMALLSVIFSSNQTLRNITSKKIYYYEIYNQRLCTRKTNSWRNTNLMLWRRRDCKGLKTGNTPWAGPCLSTVFHVKHVEVIIIVLRSASPEQRFNDIQKLYQWFRNQYLIENY